MPGRRYSDAAVIFQNTVLLFLAVNVILWALLRWRGAGRQFDPIAAFGLDRVARSYPGWRREDVIALDREMAKLDASIYQYEPYTQFKHRPVRGRYLNIDARGFRLGKNQAPWPPPPSAFTIFIFGGSTTFGAGVPDSETIPSFLQETAASSCESPVAVYNFGRLGYFSTQEMLLLDRLISQDAVPRIAIFIDGVNDFHASNGDPDLTANLRALLDSQFEPLQFLRDLPMWRAAAAIRRQKPGAADSFRYDDPQFLARVVQRLRMNDALTVTLSEKSNIRSVFVIQPVPVYKYDLRYHYLDGLDYSKYMKYADGARYGYPVLAGLRGDFERDQRFLWLADIQTDRRDNFYLGDGLHYTGAFCREIGERIYRFLLEGGLLSQANCHALP